MKNANSHWFKCNLILCGYSHSNGMDSKPFYPLRTSVTTPKTFVGSKVLMYYYNNCFGWLATQSDRIKARSNLCTIWVTCDVWEHHKPLLASNKSLLASMQGSKKWLVGVLNHLKQSFYVYFLPPLDSAAVTYKVWTNRPCWLHRPFPSVPPAFTRDGLAS